MATIYKTSDRIRVKLDDITVILSPLSFAQKSDVQNSVLGSDPMAAMTGATKAVKYSLKGIEGVYNADGSSYQLETDEAGNLTDVCLDDLFNLEQSTKLMLISLNLLQGVPKQFSNPETGEPLSGVEVVKAKAKSRKKK